ncbi:2-oxoacid:ferredoxin oxidoreductase subunit beta [Candidatus Thorarchaeota archaeon]|nr:MAG: 2-oxoacid:ferredoxin oxidoreductase subunit beta [Candidatus Thorarchaeota archaeon]
MVNRDDLEAPQEIQWCPGCGNFGILRALKDTIMEIGEPRHNYFIVSGIGQSGKVPHFINLNGFHTLHGRPIPIATAAAVANPGLKVIVHAGDGDTFGEGLGHMLHGARRNVNIACFIHNNGIYGLTKGQYSPTTPHGQITKTSPKPVGVPMQAVNPIGQAIIGGATFVARGFSGDMEQLTGLMVKAIKHKGFAFVEIMQPCVVFNKVWTWDFFKERTYSLDDENHDSSDKVAALEKSFEWGEKIPTGLFYKESRVTLEHELYTPREGSLVTHETDRSDLQQLIDELSL